MFSVPETTKTAAPQQNEPVGLTVGGAGGHSGGFEISKKLRIGLALSGELWYTDSDPPDEIPVSWAGALAGRHTEVWS